MTLDDYFGPRRRTESEETITPTRTNWPNAHESIRAILGKFDELQGGAPQSVSCRRVRMAAARDWVAEFGEDSAELLQLAYSRAKHAGLTIATERSLIKIAMPLKFKKRHTEICPECFSHPCTCDNQEE